MLYARGCKRYVNALVFKFHTKQSNRLRTGSKAWFPFSYRQKIRTVCSAALDTASAANKDVSVQVSCVTVSVMLATILVT
jgi:hypothetical protein